MGPQFVTCFCGGVYLHGLFISKHMCEGWLRQRATGAAASYLFPLPPHTCCRSRSTQGGNHRAISAAPGCGGIEDAGHVRRAPNSACAPLARRALVGVGPYMGR